MNSHLPYPTAALPVPVASLLDVDAVIVTHTHPDHWDEAARTLVPKHLPVFVQHEADRALLASQGFGDVRLLRDAIFQGVTLRQTTGQHGSDAAIGAIGDILGEVCGVVFEHAGEDTLYGRRHGMERAGRGQPAALQPASRDPQRRRRG